MPELVAPCLDFRQPWLEAHREWGPGAHEDGFGLAPSDEVETPAGFRAWLARLEAAADSARTLEVGRHRCTYRWVVDGDRVLGGVALRDGDDDYTRWAGHLGFGVRPSARSRGLGTWIVARSLELARGLGMARVLAVCALDNVASRRTLERGGGVFEAIGDTRFGPVRRYWFELTPSESPS